MNDPLGAVSEVIDHTCLTRWQTTDVPEYNMVVDSPTAARTSPFKFNPDLNKKIVLWNGDISCLNVEAIVHSTNENFTDRSTLSERIMHKAGPDLKKDIKQNIHICRTGDAKLTKGFKLPARYVIHTVGPRYNLRYKTAAESALFNSYRSVLQVVRDNCISSIAFCCIHSNRRGYPSSEGAHIAIRAVRRFLEHFGDSVETVVLVVNGEDEDVYISLLPLYFPRTRSEEDFAAYHLPDDVGNEQGEPVIKERQIRIMGKPTDLAVRVNKQQLESQDSLEESVTISEAFDTSVAVGAHSFAKMDGDLDKKRKQKVHFETHIALLHKEQYKRYERWLKRSQQEDLSSVEQLQCLYQSGFDNYNRPVIVFVGKNFPASSVNLDKFTLHLINVMDNVVEREYVFVYLHTLAQSQNHPDAEYIRSLYNLLDSRYKKNLAALYIVHSTFWSKIMTWVFTTFSLSDLKSRIRTIPGLEYLYQRIPMDQLELPQFVTNYDIRINGTRYYTPEQDEAIGAL